MVVDNVVQTWLVMAVEDKAVAQEGLVLNVERYRVVFYAKDGMIGAQDSEWLHNVINILIGLF